MFNQKPYFEVNREERHFCFLLAHSILSSPKFCSKFNSLLESKLELDIGTEVPDVYIEAASLRDYWRDLGDPYEYTIETHERRKAVISHVLKIAGYEEIRIDDYDLFWTTPSHEKLWSPGRWSEKAIHASHLPNLLSVKWAFNAKPDILLEYNSIVILIEAKVDSPIGRTREGYDQTEIQRLIADLLKKLVPNYGNKEFYFLLLSNDESFGIYWQELVTLTENSNLDFYTERSLSQSCG